MDHALLGRSEALGHGPAVPATGTRHAVGAAVERQLFVAWVLGQRFVTLIAGTDVLSDGVLLAWYRLYSRLACTKHGHLFVRTFMVKL